MIKRARVNIGMMEKMLIDLIENCPCCGKHCKMAMLKQKKGKKAPAVERFVKWQNVGKHMITRARGAIGRMGKMSSDLTENYPCCGKSCKMLKC